MLKTQDGLDLYTQQWIVGGAKGVIILTHGYNDHADRYRHLAQALNDAGYSLYAYDLRGHGRSTGPRGHTPAFERFLDDLEVMIGQAQAGQPGKKMFLYGHSMGGNITLNYALRRPGGLHGVIATSPWLRLIFEPPALSLAAARVVGTLVPTFSRKAALDVAHLSRDPAVQEAYRRDPLLHGIITVRLLAEITAGGAYAVEHAGDLRVPVLLIHGGDDKITSAAATRTFFARVLIPDKTFKLYEGMRHETHNEFGKERVLADVIAWLDHHA